MESLVVNTAADISAEDIQRALVGNAVIKAQDNAMQRHATGGPINQDRVILSGQTTLSTYRIPERSSAASVTYTPHIGDSVDVDFDEAVWRIYVPGVPRENIQVFTVSDKIHVDVEGSSRKTFALDKGETVKSTKLELGVLTIVIDRPAKRIAVEIE